MKIFKIILLCSIFINSLFAQNIDSIINSMIKTYGGSQNLQKALRYEQEWSVLALSNNTYGFDKREVLLPIELKTELIYPTKSETRVISILENYRMFNGVKEEVSGIKEQAMKLQLKRLYSPIILKSIKKELVLEDYPNHHALVYNTASDKTIYFINKKTFLIEQVTGIISIGKQDIIFNTSYTMFKKFKGVLFAHKEYKSTNNVRTAVLELKEISFN